MSEEENEALVHSITQILFNMDYSWKQRIDIVREMLKPKDTHEIFT